MSLPSDLSTVANIHDVPASEWLGAFSRLVVEKLTTDDDPSIALEIKGWEFEFRLMRTPGGEYERFPDPDPLP